MKYSEETLQKWVKPLSKTEDERVKNAISMIRNAIDVSTDLDSSSCDVFVQGSYANNTNVRQNSDVDVCVMLKSVFYYEIPNGYTINDYNFSRADINYNAFKNNVIKALINKFGQDAIKIGNKSIIISSNSYHVNADVVPAVLYRDYKTPNSSCSEYYFEGIKYFARDGSTVINFPQRHIVNGRAKNIATHSYYKGLVRIMKNILNNMIDDGKADERKITSFLIECLIYNVPNDIIVDNDTGEKTIKETIKYLWKSINNSEYKKWKEVNGILLLFRSNRKWKPSDVKIFLEGMYKYLEF